MMLRFVAMHHVLRYMTACLDANYQDIRSSRESPDGHQRLLKLKQCMDTLKNVTSIPSVELYGFLIAYKPIMSELATLHAESKADAISHPALASLHRDVAELLAEALDLTAKAVAQPSTLHSEFQALVRRKLRLRSIASSSTTNASPAAACTPSGSKSAPDAPVAAAAPAATEQEGASRAMSSPPPHSATAAAGSGVRDDSPEFASVFLRYAACASWGKGPGGCFISQLCYSLYMFARFLALDRPYGGVIDWCAEVLSLFCLLLNSLSFIPGACALAKCLTLTCHLLSGGQRR